MTTAPPRDQPSTHRTVDGGVAPAPELLPDRGHRAPGTSAPAGSASQRPRRVRQVTNADVGLLLGSLVSSLAVTWLVVGRLLPVDSDVAFVLAWCLLFLTTYWFLVWQTQGRPAAADRLAAVVVAVGGLGLVVPVVLIVGYVVVKGAGAIRLNLFTQDLSDTGPQDPLSHGGFLAAIVGTVEQVGAAVLLAVPLGILTAVFLNEVGGRLMRPVRLFVDAMSGLPSIVAGLFIYAAVVVPLGRGFFGAAGSLALAALMLPTITRTAEEVLRLVPDGLREASLALGAPRWRTVVSVVLPTARSGLVTAVVLGIARAVGETAPLILTIGGAQSFNANLLPTSPTNLQDALPYRIYQLFRSPSPVQVERGWGGALVLIVAVLMLFTTARLVGGRGGMRAGTRRFLPALARGRDASAAMPPAVEDPASSRSAPR